MVTLLGQLAGGLQGPGADVNAGQGFVYAMSHLGQHWPVDEALTRGAAGLGSPPSYDTAGAGSPVTLVGTAHSSQTPLFRVSAYSAGFSINQFVDPELEAQVPDWSAVTFKAFEIRFKSVVLNHGGDTVYVQVTLSNTPEAESGIVPGASGFPWMDKYALADGGETTNDLASNHFGLTYLSEAESEAFKDSGLPKVASFYLLSKPGITVPVVQLNEVQLWALIEVDEVVVELPEAAISGAMDYNRRVFT